MSPRHFLFGLTFFCASSAGPLDAAEIMLPQLPLTALALHEGDNALLSQEDIRGQLHAYLAPGELLVQDVKSAEGAPPTEQFERHLGEPRHVAHSIRIHPVVDLVDSRYALIRHDHIPVLLDWFEALVAGFGYTPEETRQVGYRSNKVARLMRVFTTIRLRQEGEAMRRVAPAIGWCRILFQESWGRCLPGETHTFLLVATEQGWCVVDPYGRLMRAYDPKDRRWVLELVVM